MRLKERYEAARTSLGIRRADNVLISAEQELAHYRHRGSSTYPYTVPMFTRARDIAVRAWRLAEHQNPEIKAAVEEIIILANLGIASSFLKVSNIEKAEEAFSMAKTQMEKWNRYDLQENSGTVAEEIYQLRRTKKFITKLERTNGAREMLAAARRKQEPAFN